MITLISIIPYNPDSRMITATDQRQNLFNILFKYYIKHYIYLGFIFNDPDAFGCNKTQPSFDVNNKDLKSFN